MIEFVAIAGLRRLLQRLSAVHGAMAGYTGFTTGLVCNRVVMMPITELVANSPRFLDPAGRTWERVLCQTHQPFDPASAKTR